MSMLEEKEERIVDPMVTKTFEDLDHEVEKQKLVEQSLDGYDLRMVYAVKTDSAMEEDCFSLYNSAGTLIGMTENLSQAKETFLQYDLEVCHVH